MLRILIGGNKDCCTDISNSTRYYADEDADIDIAGAVPGWGAELLATFASASYSQTQ